MKTLLILFINLILITSISGQKIAFKDFCTDENFKCWNAPIVSNLRSYGLDVYSYNSPYFKDINNGNVGYLTSEQTENLKAFGFEFIIFNKGIKIKTAPFVNMISDLDPCLLCFDSLIYENSYFEGDFYVFKINGNELLELKLIVSTGQNPQRIESCSNLQNFIENIKKFVQDNNPYIYNNENIIINANSSLIPRSKRVTENKKNKTISESNNNSDIKFKVVRVKERNPGNNYPISIDVYDKSLSLKVGDNIIITRTDEVKIPGEMKTEKSETNIGKAKITEDFNKPLYTAKLVANTGFNMKDYKDGDENYNAVIGVQSKTIVASPKIMVIPKKIDPSKYVNGEYQLTKEEKILIAAFKNKFEDNKYTTYGFESSLKSVLENRQFNDNVQDDIKSKILESSGMDFFVEYENLDQDNKRCDKVFDFKIRNYSTGEDVASDVKNLNSCGSPEDYKSFASAILNAGAISKINTQFSSLLSNGRKVSVIFTIANSSQATFNKDYDGTKLKDHIENCLQGLAFNGNLDIDGVVNLRMETSVNIPIINENTGKSYTTNTFSEDIIVYLKKNANVECESSVSKQIVSIKIK